MPSGVIGPHGYHIASARRRGPRPHRPCARRRPPQGPAVAAARPLRRDLRRPPCRRPAQHRPEHPYLVVKQDNNGATFVISDIEIPGLTGLTPTPRTRSAGRSEAGPTPPATTSQHRPAGHHCPSCPPGRQPALLSRTRRRPVTAEMGAKISDIDQGNGPTRAPKPCTSGRRLHARSHRADTSLVLQTQQTPSHPPPAPRVHRVRPVLRRADVLRPPEPPTPPMRPAAHPSSRHSPPSTRTTARPTPKARAT